MFLPEPQDLCIKPERFVLVVNHDACELDAHESSAKFSTPSVLDLRAFMLLENCEPDGKVPTPAGGT